MLLIDFTGGHNRRWIFDRVGEAMWGGDVKRRRINKWKIFFDSEWLICFHGCDYDIGGRSSLFIEGFIIFTFSNLSKEEVH